MGKSRFVFGLVAVAAVLGLDTAVALFGMVVMVAGVSDVWVLVAVAYGRTVRCGAAVHTSGSLLCHSGEWFLISLGPLEGHSLLERTHQPNDQLLCT